MEARRELDGSAAGRIAAARDNLARLETIRNRERGRLEVGSGSASNDAEAQDEYLGARLALARAEGGDDRAAEPMPAGDDPADAAILAMLERPVALPFEKGATLDDVLMAVRRATAGPEGRGIPIYVDPVGLKEAKVTMDSVVVNNLEGVPLKSSLRLMLGQLGLGYAVRDGLLIVGKKGSPELEKGAVAR